MTGPGPVPAAEALSRWQQQIRDLLRPLLPPGTRVALLDAPTTANWGDVAIWLGQRELLRQLEVEVVQIDDDRAFEPARVQRALGDDGVVLLPGGGSLGDIYRDRMAHREHVLATLRGTRIVQLSQSVHFDHPENLERLKRLIGEHGDVHVHVRDDPSLELARRELDCDVALCPDLAAGLDHLQVPYPPSADILWIHRKGPEAPDGDTPEIPAGVIRSDWSPAPGHRVANSLDLLVPAVHKRLYRAGTDLAEPLRQRLLPAVPRFRLRLALRFLSQGKVVVTDRLHGHILAMLAGKPSVLIDNRIGKLRAFHDTWSSGVEGVHLADSAAHALQIAADVAASR